MKKNQFRTSKNVSPLQGAGRRYEGYLWMWHDQIPRNRSCQKYGQFDYNLGIDLVRPQQANVKWSSLSPSTKHRIAFGPILLLRQNSVAYAISQNRTKQNRKKNIDHWIWEQIRYSVCSSLSTPMASMPICVMCVFNVQNYAIYIYLIYEKKNELKEDKSILFDPREQRHRMKKKQNRTNSIPISTQFCSIPFGPPNPEHPRTRSCPMLLLLFVSLLTLHNTKCSHQQIPFNVNKNQMVSNKVDVITIPVSEQQMHSRHPTYQLQRQSSQ